MLLSPQITGLPEGAPLNPFQELVAPMRKRRVNAVIVAPTASGKTVAISILARRVLRRDAGQNGALVYVAPMKALVEEKKRAWTKRGHPYAELELAVLTGDYVGAPSKDRGDPDTADIIVVTPEALASKIRNGAEWIHRVGMLAVDEAHFVGEEGRGANLEAALLEFTRLRPKCPVALFSATVPNHHDLVEFVSSLNELETEVVVSDYRPTVLHRHYVTLEEWTYTDRYPQIEHNARKLIEEHPNDQFLIVVFSKDIGYNLRRDLGRDHSVDFHSADLNRSDRERVERQFLEGGIRVLVTTTTLVVGMNLPARRVIVTYPEAGGKDVPATVMHQAGGRAGRPPFDTEGDVYYFLPRKSADRHERRIEQGEPVLSQLNTAATIALHFMGAVKLGIVSNEETFVAWYERSLHDKQAKLGREQKNRLLQSIVDDLEKRKMLRVKEGEFSLSRLGLVCVQMSLDPYHAADLVTGFDRYFALSSPDTDDLARALGGCGVYSEPMNSWKIEKMAEYAPVHKYATKGIPAVFWKSVFAHSCVLVGAKDAPWQVRSTYLQIKQDFDRVCTTLARIRSETKRWIDDAPDGFFEGLPLRAFRGVDETTARVMSSQRVGKSTAKLLLSSGFEKVAEAGRHDAEVYGEIERQKTKRGTYR